MCGLFGAIGKNINRGIIRALALINRERGTHGIGLFDNSGKMIKAGCDALRALQNAEFSAFIRHADRWFLAGHTRHATQGSISDRNAHPFKYGAFIGSHNGCVWAPKAYTVDSEYLIDSLDKAGGDYQKALADINGWWGLTWFDGESFYMQASGNEISFCRDASGTYYYSSDDEHLVAATGISHNVLTLQNGNTIRFRPGCEDFDVLPDLVLNRIPIGYKTERTYIDHADKADKADRKGRKEKAKDKPWFVWDEWDQFAKDLGWDDLQDVMDSEGLRSRQDAIDFLEDAGRYAAWDEYTKAFE